MRDSSRGSREARLLAVALETLVGDVPPVGDADVARRSGSTLSARSHLPRTPGPVELDDGPVSLSNPPFLLMELDIKGATDDYVPLSRSTRR